MDLNEKIFIVDTNTFITPYKTYYPFDMAPPFWDFFRTNIENGRIIVLSKVYEEVLKGNDDLSQWLQSFSAMIVDHRQQSILVNYSHVLTHIQTNPAYNDKALTEWADTNCADPWIISAAMAFGYSVITFEQPNRSLGASISSHPKIPDVCFHFNIKCGSLYDMMRALDFSFK